LDLSFRRFRCLHSTVTACVLTSVRSTLTANHLLSLQDNWLSIFIAVMIFLYGIRSGSDVMQTKWWRNCGWLKSVEVVVIQGKTLRLFYRNRENATRVLGMWLDQIITFHRMPRCQQLRYTLLCIAAIPVLIVSSSNFIILLVLVVVVVVVVVVV